MGPALRSGKVKRQKKKAEVLPFRSKNPLTWKRQEKLNEQLLEGAQEDSLEKVKDALSNGADANAVDSFNNSALIYANDIEIARLLVGHGADVNHLGDEATPLIYAAQYNKREMVEFLLSEDADANAKDILGQTALHLCARWESHLEVAKMLIASDADVNARCLYSRSPLDHAMHSRNEKMIDILRRYGARECTPFVARRE